MLVFIMKVQYNKWNGKYMLYIPIEFIRKVGVVKGDNLEWEVNEDNFSVPVLMIAKEPKVMGKDEKR